MYNKDKIYKDFLRFSLVYGEFGPTEEKQFNSFTKISTFFPVIQQLLFYDSKKNL